MAKKKTKEISLDDLEEELTDSEEVEKVEDEEIKEIEEFSLDEISEEEVSEVFEEELEELEELEEAPKEEIIDERIYVIPLAKARHGPRNKRAKKLLGISENLWNAISNLNL